MKKLKLGAQQKNIDLRKSKNLTYLGSKIPKKLHNISCLQTCFVFCIFTKAHPFQVFNSKEEKETILLTLEMLVGQL